jgi:flagellar hook-length control protein FliK
MNIGSLANTFVGNVGAAPAISKPAATQDTMQFTEAPFCNKSQSGNPHPAPVDAPATTTTEKIATDVQNTPVNKPPRGFQHTLGKKTIAEEPEEQGSTFAVALQPNVVQSWLAGYPLVEHGEKGLVREMEPKAGRELAQLLADLKAGEFAPVTAQAAKSDEIELLLTTDNGQFGLKDVLSDISKGTLTADTQPGEGKNAGKIQISGKTLITIKGLMDQQISRGLMPEVLTTGNKTTTTSEKPAIADTSAASGSQKTPSLSGKELMPEALVDGGSKTAAAGEKPAMADKLAVSDGQKTPVLNGSFPTAQDKSTELQQKIPVGPKKSALIAEKPAGNKADTAQQGHTGVPGLSESSDGNAKEHSGNPLGDSILHKLDPAQVRVSTNQTKDHGSSTSNNSSNSDFEQVFSSNNPQSPIAEQAPVFSSAAKTVGNFSPSDASANISEQIQGSINSSLRQGDQQITIRLNPPELGKVSIKFQEQGDQITGLLEVDKIQTRYEIQQALPQIVRNLADSGIQIKRLEVVLTAQPEQQPYKDQSLQDSWSGQQAGTEGNNPNHDAVGANEWLTNNSSYAGFTEPQEMLVTDDSINVLI